MDFLELFQENLRENSKSENTIGSYVSDIKQFLQFTGKDITETTTDDINSFKENLFEAGRSIKTINRKLASLSQFVEYLNDDHDINIKAKIKQEKIATQEFMDDMLELNDVRRIIRAAEKQADIRTVTVCYTLFYTGARVSEMLQIKVKDIDKDTIKVKGKGNKYRDLLVPKKLRAQWKKYLEARNDTTEFLFSGTRGPINRQTVHNDIKYFTGQARGIDKDISHAHAFRHLYAQSLAELGVNPVIISQLLGHSLNVTGQYIQSSKRELLKIIDKIDLKIDAK